MNTVERAEQEYNLHGLSIEDTLHPIKTWHQLGGRGVVYNKGLVIPSHINTTSPTLDDAPWNSLEHVEIPACSGGASPSSVGQHEQFTDEIYYIYQGRGRLYTHGTPTDVLAGTLVIAPIGTVHSIENPFPDTSLAFLVIELRAVQAAEEIHKPCLLNSLPLVDAPDLTAICGNQTVSLQVRRVDLSSYFTAPWNTLSVIEVPPGSRIPEYILPTLDENLFVLSGFATFLLPGDRVNPLEEDGHNNVLVPWGLPRTIINSSSRDPLRLLSVRVHRQVHGLSRRRSPSASESLAP